MKKTTNQIKTLFITLMFSISLFSMTSCHKKSDDPTPILNPVDTTKNTNGGNIITIAEDWNYYFNINVTPDTSQRQNYPLTFINYNTTQKMFRYKNANQYLYLSLPNTKVDMLKYISDS